MGVPNEEGDPTDSRSGFFETFVVGVFPEIDKLYLPESLRSTVVSPFVFCLGVPFVAAVVVGGGDVGGELLEEGSR